MVGGFVIVQLKQHGPQEETRNAQRKLEAPTSNRNYKCPTEGRNTQRKLEAPKSKNQKHPKDTGSTQRKLGMAKRKLETPGKLETRKEN